MVAINKIYCTSSAFALRYMDDSVIDLTLTSPPYDNLKDYGNVSTWNFDIFKDIADQLVRVTKEGGVVVWVVGDATVKGSETGTSFRQALYFKEIGLNLWDTMIYEKSGFANPSSNRYHQIFEYMFVFTKGKPKTFNPIKDRPNKYVGFCGGEKSFRGEFGMRFNIWRYPNRGNNTSKNALVFKHPAPFPEQLAVDHIKTWSNEGDLVLDPFMGSGTTAWACKSLKRNYIGFEISQEYCQLAEQRLA